MDINRFDKDANELKVILNTEKYINDGIGIVSGLEKCVKVTFNKV